MESWEKGIIEPAVLFNDSSKGYGFVLPWPSAEQFFQAFQILK